MTPDEKWDEIQKWVNWSVAYMTLMDQQKIEEVEDAWGSDIRTSERAIDDYIAQDHISKPSLDIIYILGTDAYVSWIADQFNRMYNTTKELNT